MTKKRLQNYQSIKRELVQIHQQIEEVEAKIYAPSASKLSAEPRGGGGISDPTGRGAVKHKELLDLYQAKLDELTAEQLAIEKAIDSLDGTARTLMRYKYIDGHTWEEVCLLINYSWAQTHRLHARALEQLRRAGEE